MKQEAVGSDPGGLFAFVCGRRTLCGVFTNRTHIVDSVLDLLVYRLAGGRQHALAVAVCTDCPSCLWQLDHLTAVAFRRGCSLEKLFAYVRGDLRPTLWRDGRIGDEL